MVRQIAASRDKNYLELRSWAIQQMTDGYPMAAALNADGDASCCCAEHNYHALKVFHPWDHGCSVDSVMSVRRERVVDSGRP